MSQLIKQRLLTAFSTFPTVANLLKLAPTLLVLGFILLLIGFKSNFLYINLLPGWEKIAKIVAMTFLRPALGEELIFRILFLPHPDENPSIKKLFFWGVITMTVFIIYHPLEALTWYPAGRDVFVDPYFLILATLLGVMCTIAYSISGSLWLPVIIHWLAVAIWLVLLGGCARLGNC